MDDIRDGIDDAFRRAFLQRRGPMPGFGRSAGRPWRGIVEKTPALWVTWITGACKRAGVDPLSVRLTFSGQPLEMATVELTFGTRYYWLCPRCGNRCEAVYATRACVACRECSHLGYQSQVTRSASPFRTLNQIFSRRASGRPTMRSVTSHARSVARVAHKASFRSVGIPPARVTIWMPRESVGGERRRLTSGPAWSRRWRSSRSSRRRLRCAGPADVARHPQP